MQRLLLPFKEFRLAAHKRKTTYTGKHTQSEMCTAKSAYNTLAISYAQLHPPPTIPTQTIDILKQDWKDKSMQPRIKTFAWRILREAIPTGNRIQSIVSKADGKCAACGQQETDLHHFFHCHLPRATWFRLPTAMRTDLMPLDQDMVFYINFIINQNPAAFTLSFVLTVNTALVPLES